MRNAIIAFVVVLSFTCLFGGNSMSRTYMPVGVETVKVEEKAILPAMRRDNMVAEINLVDMGREYNGAATIADTDLHAGVDFPNIGRF